MVVGIGSASGCPQERLAFAVEIFQSSAEYSLIAQDPWGKILLWNEGARRLYGYAAEEIVGNSWEILFTPDDVAAGLPAAMRETALANGKWEGVVAGVRADGERVMAHAVLTPHFDPAGEHAGALLVSRDIGREVTVAQAVEGLLEAAPDAMMVAGLDRRILLANGQTEKLFGYTRDELTGMPVELLVPDAFASRQDPECFGVRRDGSRFPVEIELSPLESDGQRYLIGAVRDVTFRKKAEEKFRGLLESAPEAMVIVNQEGRIVLVNSRVEKLFGYPRAKMLGDTLELLIPQPHAGDDDLFGRRADGSEFPVEVSHSPIETEDGILVSSSIRDVTDRKRFERALQEKNVELARANQAKDRFLATMSHELRTPLNAIIGFTGTLLMRLPGPLTADQEKQLRTVQTSGRHLLSLINDLLDLAKIESGKVEIRTEAVACLAAVEETVAALRPAAEAKSISLEATVEPSDLSVLADRRALTQILLNLTSNAVKFTDRGGIAISVRRHRDEGRKFVAFQVSDTGVGIAAEDREKLFQPFSQVPASRRPRREGTGLGLHLSRKLAELLGGEIRLRSEPGQGSTFTLLLEEA
ncbi:MAG: PAS domain S-box protein [Ignavibacteriota bacterium]